MLMKLDPAWLLMTVAAVSMLSFFLGYAIHGLVGEMGFGPYGNGAIIAAGFFLAIYGSNWYGIRFQDAKLAMGAGLLGAFVCLASLTFLKRIMARM